MKYQDHSSFLISAFLTITFLVLGAVSSVCHSSCEVANPSNMTPTRHVEGASPTSVEVTICPLSGEEITRLILEKPVTPQKLYSELQKIEGYEWTNEKIYQLFNGNVLLNPLSDEAITLENDNVINLNYLTLSQYPEDDISKTFINHDHAESRFEEDGGFYSDYFIMHFAVRKDGYALKYAPNELKTPELCLAAVEHHGWSIQYIPDEKKSPAVCLAAVQKHGSLIQYIPNDKKTLEVCLAAIRKTGLHMLEYIPENENTLQICLQVYEEYGPWMKMYIHYIPRGVRSQFKKLVGFD